MMRLLGVLVGSALAVGALVVFVGIPEFTTEESVAENMIITLPMRPAAGSDALPEPEPGVLPDTGPVPDVEQSGDSLQVAEDDAVPAAESQNAGASADAPPAATGGTAMATQAAEEARQWYAFWSPFHSEIAASGFVDQLQRVTGLDYRVIKIKPGVYEVAFAYADDDEITSNLSQITAATGLQLPEG